MKKFVAVLLAFTMFMEPLLACGGSSGGAGFFGRRAARRAAMAEGGCSSCGGGSTMVASSCGTTSYSYGPATSVYGSGGWTAVPCATCPGGVSYVQTSSPVTYTSTPVTYASTAAAPAGYTAVPCAQCPGGICYVPNTTVAAAPAVTPLAQVIPGVNCPCVAAYGFCPCCKAAAPAVPATAPAPKATTYGDPFSDGNKKVTVLPNGKKMICDGDKCYIVSEVVPEVPADQVATVSATNELVVAARQDAVTQLVASTAKQYAVAQLVQQSAPRSVAVVNAANDLANTIPSGTTQVVARND